MTLIEQIKEKQLIARKAKDVVASNLYTCLIGDAENVGKTKLRMPTDDEVLSLVKKFLKDADFNLGINISDAKTIRERELLLDLQPKQLTEEEIRDIVDICVDNGGDFPTIMKFFKTEYANRYDGKLLARIVKEG